MIRLDASASTLGVRRFDLIPTKIFCEDSDPFNRHLYSLRGCYFPASGECDVAAFDGPNGPSKTVDVPSARDLEKSSSGVRRAAVFTQPPEKADIRSSLNWIARSRSPPVRCSIVNVNRRLPILLAWLKSAKPDIVCLQELKAEKTALPANTIRETGYNAVRLGQWTWNGVAILSRRREIHVTREQLPEDPSDKQQCKQDGYYSAQTCETMDIPQLDVDCRSPLSFPPNVYIPPSC